MKAQDLLIIGGLFAGILLLSRFFGKSSEGGGGGGGGGQYWDDIQITTVPELIRSYDTRYGGFTQGGIGITGGGYVPPSNPKAAITQALQAGATVYLTHPGGRLRPVGTIPGTTRAGALTTGTPTQQIEQFLTGKKIVAGKKVM